MSSRWSMRSGGVDRGSATAVAPNRSSGSRSPGSTSRSIGSSISIVYPITGPFLIRYSYAIPDPRRRGHVATAAQTKFIRPDGKDKVTGLGRYTADLTMTGMLHACFRYADHAHARIRSIDTGRARALPGVFCVLTQDDVPDVRYGPFVEDRTLFARDVVRYEGEVVAAVAATTPEIARQAADLIDVDYEPLPVVSDVEAALADGATLVHEGWSGYSASEDVVRTGNDASRSTIVKGDV